MNQSSFIITALLAGFILYLAAKNRLTAYTAVLWGAAPAPASLASTTGANSPQSNISNSIFGAGSSTTPTMNPIQGLTSAVGSVVGPLIGNALGF